VSPPSVLRFAATFGSATILGQLGQLAWLGAASRALTARDFGTVLAAQTLYGALQVVIDIGPSFYGARLAAAGTLDERERGRLVRLRLQVAIPGAAALLLTAALSDRRSLEASAPFAVALLLFGTLNYWERFGRGDSKPWSAYIVARSVVPAAGAGLTILVGTRFPLPLAGLVECGLILGIAAVFRLRLVWDLRLALRAARGPWPGVVAIGLPVLLSQVGMAAGPVLLTMVGATAAAGAVAVGLRLLTGVNGLAGVVAVSTFPRLARDGTRSAPDAADARAILAGAQLAFAMGAAALAVLLARTPFFVELLLNRSDATAQKTAVILLSGALAGALLLVVTMAFVARRQESQLLPAYIWGGLVTLGGTGVAVAAGSGNRAPLVAAAIALGQLVTLVVLLGRLDLLGPAVAARGRLASIAAVGAVAVGIAAALHPLMRVPTAAVAMAIAVAAVVSAARRPRNPRPPG
jgi:O-antigen/teichoic acid export membrane protein